MTRLRDVIISASLLTALSLFSCGKSGSGPQEVRGDTPDDIATKVETPGNAFKAENVLPGRPVELVDTPQVYPQLNGQNAWWVEPDGKYTYAFHFTNVSGREVTIERVEFETEPSDTPIIRFVTRPLRSTSSTLAVIKVSKPWKPGLRHVTFHIKGQKTPEVHTMEILEKIPYN